MRVLIAGGGLGGLLLAHRIIKEDTSKKIEVVILERDAGPDARGQGIVIGLAQDGVNCLNKVGLGDIYEALVGEESPKDLIMRSHNGVRTIVGRRWLCVKLANGKKASCLVPRAQLRQELAKSLPENIIRWNSKVVSAQQVERKLLVTLDDGTTVEGDILIGADGARSGIRKQYFPNLLPAGLNLWTFWGVISESKQGSFGEKCSLVEDAKTSLTRTNGLNGCSMLCFMFYPKGATKNSGQGELFWAISLPRKLVASIADNPSASHLEIRTALLEITKTAFGEPAVSQLIEFTDNIDRGYELTSVEPAIFKKGRVCPSENEDLCVTLIGDAAHKTTTQAGLGATAAYMDALDLADTILKKGEALCAKDLREYETRMCSRAVQYVGWSYGNTKRIHVERGLVGDMAVTAFMWSVGCIISGVGALASLFS